MKKRIVLILVVVLVLAVGLKISAANDLSYSWNPYLGEVNQDSISISWKTNLPTTDLIKYASEEVYQDKGFTKEKKIKTKEKFNQIKLSNLKNNTEYRYQIISTSDSEQIVKSKPTTFMTAGGSELTDFSFIVYGDTRTYQGRHKKVMEKMAREKPRFVIHLGDLVDDGRFKLLFNDFFDAIEPVAQQTPFIPVIGNHEQGADNYYQLFDLYDGGGKFNEQWYSFDYGSVKFISLSSQALLEWHNQEAMQEQTEWLKEELETSQAKFNFVLFHQPAYSSVKAPGSKQLRKKWGPIFKEYNVDAVFNADAHSYERFNIDGLPYVVTAGGGAPLYDIEEKQPNSKVLDVKHLHYVRIDIKDSEAIFKVKKAYKVPQNTINVTNIEPASGLLDKFVIEKD